MIPNPVVGVVHPPPPCAYPPHLESRKEGVFSRARQFSFTFSLTPASRYRSPALVGGRGIFSGETRDVCPMFAL